MKKTNKYMLLGMSIGMCFGVSLGLTLFNNIAIGIPIGMCIGMAIGAAKDAAINKQAEEKGYTVKSIDEVGKDSWSIIIADKNGEEKTVTVPKGIMDEENFCIGDTVFLDEDGNIEQAFDKDEE